MNELWKPVVGYEGRYEVSNFGRIKSFTKYSKGILLGLGKTVDGYPQVCLSLTPGARPKYRRVHVLVLEAFKCIRPAGHDACHTDGTRDNNHISNLRWATRKENMEDRTRHGTAAACEDNGRAKLTNKDVIEIRYMHKQGAHWKTLAYAYEVSRSTIFYIVAGKTWKNPSRSETTRREGE